MEWKVIVEKHADGYVAYPVGLKGVVVAQGDTYEEALADLRSAVAFHVETFGPDPQSGWSSNPGEVPVRHGQAS